MESIKQIFDKIGIYMFKVYLIRLEFQKKTIKSDSIPEEISLLDLSTAILIIYLLIYVFLIVLGFEVVFYELTLLSPIFLYYPVKKIIKHYVNKNIKIHINEREVDIYGILVGWAQYPIMIICILFIAHHAR